MSKRKKTKKHPRHSLRNAGPRAPRAPRKTAEEETPLRRLAYTAAAAGGTALVGSILLHEGWAPKTVGTALAAVGTGLAWRGDESTVRSIGSGMMSSAIGQLAVITTDEHDSKSKDKNAKQDTRLSQSDQDMPSTQTAKKPSNAAGLPPGSLESALDRARSRLRLAAREQEAMA